MYELCIINLEYHPVQEVLKSSSHKTYKNRVTKGICKILINVWFIDCDFQGKEENIKLKVHHRRVRKKKKIEN